MGDCDGERLCVWLLDCVKEAVTDAVVDGVVACDGLTLGVVECDPLGDCVRLRVGVMLGESVTLGVSDAV